MLFLVYNILVSIEKLVHILIKHFKLSTRFIKLNKGIYINGLKLKSLFFTIKYFIFKIIKVNQELLNNMNKIMIATK